MNLKGETVSKVLGIVVAVATGVSAVMGALNQQKKDAEFEDMKKALAELKGKES